MATKVQNHGLPDTLGTAGLTHAASCNTTWKPPEPPLSHFPSNLRSELCWTSEQYTENPIEYVTCLAANDASAVRAAISRFKSMGIELPMISPENFQLPERLSQTLRQASDEVHNGRGFVVIRGLHDEARSDEDTAIMFCGLSSHFGRIRATGPNGMAMEHLRDASRDPIPTGMKKAELHPSKMMAPLKFHADRKLANVIALYVKATPSAGGNQYLSSFWTIYNQMMAECPEDLQVLAQNFPWPEMIGKTLHTSHHPVMFHHQGRIFCQLVYRIYDTSILSDRQLRALDQVEHFANKNCIEILPQPGDLQFINNFGLLHARRSWVDDASQPERHYLRLGLHDPKNAWERPLGYEWLFDASLRIPPAHQTIPITDFDPYGKTSLAQDHG